jgi:hypothetical protein
MTDNTAPKLKEVMIVEESDHSTERDTVEEYHKLNDKCEKILQKIKARKSKKSKAAIKNGS